MNLPSYAAVKVTYLSATDTQPLRMKLTRFWGKKYLVTLPFKYHGESGTQQAAAWLIENGFTPVSVASLDDNTDIILVEQL